ncbi:MAG: MobF family relaxase, partial [Acidimicrobiales bacterium]
MLIVTPVSAGAVRYFLEAGAEGRWVGHGSDALGLAGTAAPGQLEAVLDGRAPDGDDLVEHRLRNRRAGWDLTLAAPKSLSLLGALSPPDAAASIDGVQRGAVEDALDYLERRSSCLRGGKEVPSVGLVGAAFEHRASSAGEPHFHTHVLIANLGRTEDGPWSALHGNSIWPHQRAMGAIYELALRERMRVEGWDVGWTLSARGLADLADVPRSAVEAASSRHMRIAEGLDEFMAPSRGTRTATKHVTRDEVRDLGWRDRAAAAGFGAAEAGELAHRAWSPALSPDSPPVEG